MRLSEAILLGIGFVPENRSHFLMNGCGCAIGAALRAIGYEDSINGGADCRKEWPWTAEKHGYEMNIATMISVKHYCYKESRKSIAIWISSLEDKLGITDGQVSKEKVSEVENALA